MLENKWNFFVPNQLYLESKDVLQRGVCYRPAYRLRWCECEGGPSCPECSQLLSWEGHLQETIVNNGHDSLYTGQAITGHAYCLLKV